MTAGAIQCGMLFFFEHPHHEPRVSKTAAFDEFSIHSFANLYRQQLFLVADFLKKKLLKLQKLILQRKKKFRLNINIKKMISVKKAVLDLYQEIIL